MFVQLTASSDGVAASLLYGPRGHWGWSNSTPGVPSQDPSISDQGAAAPGARIIDVQAQDTSNSTDQDGSDASEQADLLLSAGGSATSLTYAVPRGLGQPPKLVSTSAGLGQIVDYYA